MKEVNKKLIQGYTLLLKIITSLRGCKKRNNYKKGDPEEMLTELAYSLKSFKKKSIGEIILLHANNIFKRRRGLYKLDFLISQINHCIGIMQKGLEIDEIKKKLKLITRTIS